MVNNTNLICFFLAAAISGSACFFDSHYFSNSSYFLADAGMGLAADAFKNSILKGLDRLSNIR